MKFLYFILLLLCSFSNLSYAQVWKNWLREPNRNNPALYAFAPTEGLNISLLGLDILQSNNAFTLKLINEMSGKYLDNNLKDSLLAMVSDLHGWQIYGVNDGLGARVLFKNFSFEIGGYLKYELIAPKELLELALYGNELYQDYTIEGLSGEEYSFIYGGAAFGSKLSDNLALGIGTYVVRGIQAISINAPTAFIEYNESNLVGEVIINQDEANGSMGVLFEGGIAYQPTVDLILSLWAYNLGGGPSFNVNGKRKVNSVFADSLGGGDYDSLSFELEESDTSYSIPKIDITIDPFMRAEIWYFPTTETAFRWWAEFPLSGETNIPTRMYLESFWSMIPQLDFRAGVGYRDDILLLSGIDINIKNYSLGLLIESSGGIGSGIAKGYRAQIVQSIRFDK